MWQQFITPETVPQFVAAFAVLVAAVAFAIRSAAGAITRYAEIKATLAKTKQDDIASENERQKMMLELIANQQRSQLAQQDIMRQQADNSADISKILEQTRQDIVVFRDVSQNVAKALEAYTNETKALRLDLKVWPATVDSSLSTLDTHINDMRSEVTGMDKDLKLLIAILSEVRDEQKHDIVLNKWLVVILSAVYEKLIGGPPPPLPDDHAKVIPLRTDADGAKHNAEVDAA